MSTVQLTESCAVVQVTRRPGKRLPAVKALRRGMTLWTRSSSLPGELEARGSRRPALRSLLHEQNWEREDVVPFPLVGELLGSCRIEVFSVFQAVSWSSCNIPMVGYYMNESLEWNVWECIGNIPIGGVFQEVERMRSVCRIHDATYHWLMTMNGTAFPLWSSWS